MWRKKRGAAGSELDPKWHRVRPALDIHPSTLASHSTTSGYPCLAHSKKKAQPLSLFFLLWETAFALTDSLVSTCQLTERDELCWLPTKPLTCGEQRKSLPNAVEGDLFAPYDVVVSERLHKRECSAEFPESKNGET